MPLEGSLIVRDDGLPEMTAFDTEAVTLEKADIVQVLYEIDDDDMEAMIPIAFHPTIPPSVTFLFYQGGGGPVPPFTMGQVRLGCRAGVRPRGYLLAAVVDNPDAARELSQRWGYRCLPGEVKISRRHDYVRATAAVDGRTILDVTVVDPMPIAGTDIQFTATMNPARTPKGLRLVQVDPEFTFHKAERGQPRVDVFDAAAWGDDRVRPVYPVSACAAVADLTLPKLRYLCKPDVPTMQGTEKIG